MKNCGHCVTSVENRKKTMKNYKETKMQQQRNKDTTRKRKTIIELSLSAAAAVAITTRKSGKIIKESNCPLAFFVGNGKADDMMTIRSDGQKWRKGFLKSQ